MLKRMKDDLTALDTKLSAVAVGEGKIVYLHDFSDETTPNTHLPSISFGVSVLMSE